MSLFTQGARALTLLVASRADPASVLLFNSLMKNQGFDNLKPQEEDDILLSHRDGQFYLWLQNERLLNVNFINEAFEKRASLPPSSIGDIVFLSRHSAASGNPSLTVHPIGVPWLNDVTRVGGLPGRVSPPNPRIGHLYRSLIDKMKTSKLKDEFTVSLEATHHGPHCDIPACFVEIGSTEAEWNRNDAGDFWSEVLLEHLIDTKSIDQTSISTSTFLEQAQVAVVLIGGGHYCPKMGDVARLGKNVCVGHILASYTLNSYFEEEDVKGGNTNLSHTDETKEKAQVEGGWKHVINEAIDGTMKAFPTCRLVVLVDKKAFKSTPRNAIIDHLDSIGVNHTFKFKLSDYIQKEEEVESNTAVAH